jgi:hypothetical protein
MRKPLLVALLTAGLAVPLAAQNTPAPAASAAKPATAQQQIGNTPEDRARGAVIFRTFTIALNSDKVQPQVKNALVSCLYNNPVKNISAATGNVFEKNKNLDPKKPEQVYAVAARLCGVKPQTAKADPAKAPAQTAAAAKPAQTSGR